MRIATIILLLALGAPGARAPEQDLSSPKSAAKTLFNAINTGDRDAVAAALNSENEDQGQLAFAMADLIVAGKRLGDAAHEKFGSAGDPIGRGMLDPADPSKIDAATLNENGDSATLVLPNQTRPMSFRKRDGKWRLVITDFGGAAPDNIQKQIRLIRLMSEAIQTSATEVASGKYQTADAALTSIQQRLHGVMLTFYRPATTHAAAGEPTTQP